MKIQLSKSKIEKNWGSPGHFFVFSIRFTEISIKIANDWIRTEDPWGRKGLPLYQLSHNHW